MSAVIDTLQRCKIMDIPNGVPSLKAVDPNGVSRDLGIDSLVYATDVVHINFATYPDNYPTQVNFGNKVNGAWCGAATTYWFENLPDTHKRWFAIGITGDETNSYLTFFAATPDATVQRTS